MKDRVASPARVPIQLQDNSFSKFDINVNSYSIDTVLVKEFTCSLFQKLWNNLTEVWDIINTRVDQLYSTVSVNIWSGGGRVV